MTSGGEVGLTISISGTFRLHSVLCVGHNPKTSHKILAMSYATLSFRSRAHQLLSIISLVIRITNGTLQI